MKKVIFDGQAFATKEELELKKKVIKLNKIGIIPQVVSFVFLEDKGSRLYTQFKSQAASRVGIEFKPIWFSLSDDQNLIDKSIQNANNDHSITGVMIQKPRRKIWESWRATQTNGVGVERDFSLWWQRLVGLINPQKDFDGLSPVTQQAITENVWEKMNLVLPATVTAILKILKEAQIEFEQKVLIIGKSDIVGQPLFWVLKNQGFKVELVGKKLLAKKVAAPDLLLSYDVIISATGEGNLVTGQLVKSGVIIIDVGEPVGDIEFASVLPKSKFITPVPGGVGPVTVTSLLANAVKLCYNPSS